MKQSKRSIPQYGTVMRNGQQYYRTRIMDADGKQVSLYAATQKALYQKEIKARKEIETIIFRRNHPTVEE